MKKTIAFILVIVLCAFLYGCGEKAGSIREFPVHVRVPDSWDSVNLWAWSSEEGKNAFEAWPGIAMTGPEDRWFTANAPEWVDALVISGNDGTVQTADIVIENRELWITIYEDLSCRLEYEKPENVVLRARIPVSWEDPCCWAWSSIDKTDVFAQWPGNAMEKTGDWYTIELPVWTDSVIINGNGGSVQTADLSVESGKDFWVVVRSAENASVYYQESEIPEGPVTPEDWFAEIDALTPEQITDSKVLPCVYQIEDGNTLSCAIDLNLLPGEITAAIPEEVRYIVHYKYIARRNLNYIGLLSVYSCSITVEIVDVLTDEIVAEKTFMGPPLPKSISSSKSKYYGDYPDEAEVKEWILNNI